MPRRRQAGRTPSRSVQPSVYPWAAQSCSYGGVGHVAHHLAEDGVDGDPGPAQPGRRSVQFLDPVRARRSAGCPSGRRTPRCGPAGRPRSAPPASARCRCRRGRVDRAVGPRSGGSSRRTSGSAPARARSYSRRCPASLSSTGQITRSGPWPSTQTCRRTSAARRRTATAATTCRCPAGASPDAHRRRGTTRRGSTSKSTRRAQPYATGGPPASRPRMVSIVGIGVGLVEALVELVDAVPLDRLVEVLDGGEQAAQLIEVVAGRPAASAADARRSAGAPRPALLPIRRPRIGAARQERQILDRRGLPPAVGACVCSQILLQLRPGGEAADSRRFAAWPTTTRRPPRSAGAPRRASGCAKPSADSPARGAHRRAAAVR